MSALSKFTARLLIHSRISEIAAPLSSQPHSSRHSCEETSDDKDETQPLELRRPAEFRLYTLIPFTGLFVALMIVLAVFYDKSIGTGKCSLASYEHF